MQYDYETFHDDALPRLWHKALPTKPQPMVDGGTDVLLLQSQSTDGP